MKRRRVNFSRKCHAEPGPELDSGSSIPASKKLIVLEDPESSSG
jgi:hypothetical protein